MKWLILALTITVAGVAEAKFQNDFIKQIYVVGVGQVKLDYRYHGEPVIRPRSLAIHVKCANSKNWSPVGQYLMCSLDNYDYDSKTKKLTVKYVDGRARHDTGETFCDQAATGELDLGSLCKPNVDKGPKK